MGMNVHGLLVLIRASAGVAGFFVFNARMRTALRVQPRRLCSGVSPATEVSVIIPARNEANNLPSLLASIAALQPAALEVIVVNDHSTDDTAAVAASFGVRVVEPGPLPAGWVGKQWACAAGAAVARGRLLLFTDADTVHAPELLGLTVSALESEAADLVSVLPAHIAVSGWEKLQGVFQLLLLVATRAGASRAGGERCFCIGQYLLIRRAAYERIGGHTAIRHRVAEDLAMARLIEERGLRFALVHEPGALRVRMYPDGLSSFMAGWRRNFREGMRAAGPSGILETALVVGWLLDTPRWLMEASIAGDGVLTFLAGSAFAISCFAIARWQRHIGAFRDRSAIAYPLFALLFVWISCLALVDRALGRPVAWKGRSIRADQINAS